MAIHCRGRLVARAVRIQLCAACQAQAPDAALLGELKKRLSEPAKCVPDCVEAVMATVIVSGDRLDVQLQVHAQASVVLGIPQAGQQWVIDRVAIDDRAADSVARVGEQLHLPVAPGVHRVSIGGRIVQAYELALEFPTVPRRVVVRADGWDASGISEGRLLNSSLQLTRRATAGVTERMAASQRFAPFVRIHRRVFMGLDWTVTTTVERLAPDEGAFTLRLPLLPGESVLTPGLQVGDEGVLVSMPSGENSVGWDSALERVDRLQWSAAGSDKPWVEQWEVVVSPTWHAEFAGTPAILPNEESAEGCGSTNSCRGPARRSTCRSYGPLRALAIPWPWIASASRRASGGELRIHRCFSPIAAAAAGATTCVSPRMPRSSV